MRLIDLYLDVKGIGCGYHPMLVVREGARWVELLHPARLKKVRYPAAELQQQIAAGRARELEIRRGFLGRLQERRRQYKRIGRGYPKALVREAIAALQQKPQIEKEIP